MASFGGAKCLKMDFYGINLIVQGGRITGLYIILLSAPGRITGLYIERRSFILLRSFIDFVGGRIPGKRVFLRGYNLPENGAWQVLGEPSVLKWTSTE